MTDDEWGRLASRIEFAASHRRESGGWLLNGVEKIANGLRPVRPGIYILTYHSVVDPSSAEQWERAYQKGTISRAYFEEQIACLCQLMTPIALSEVPGKLRDGEADRPYFVITFDDGYSNIRKNAAPALARHGIRPTIFVNGGFAEGNVYYRVLAAILTASGQADPLRAELNRRLPDFPWDAEPRRLFDETKDHYVAGAIEEAVTAVFERQMGSASALGVHLSVHDVAALQAAGWEVGNHTLRHRILSHLDFEGVADEISANESYWAGHGVSLIPWLAYPNGRVTDVGPAVREWLERNSGIHGVFCSGGVNLHPTRTEWLRFFAGVGGAHAVKRALRSQLAFTIEALGDRGRTSGSVKTAGAMS